MQVKLLYQEAARKLEQLYSNEEARQIAFMLIEDLTDFTKTDLLLDKTYTGFNIQKFEQNLAALLAHTPIQYVLGYSYFYGLKFKVNSSTLIPRPETEELVNIIIKDNKNVAASLIDIGTGTGCIPIVLKQKNSNFECIGLDINQEIIDLAYSNAKSFNIDVKFFVHDILSRESLPIAGIDILVSNPPYIPVSEKESISTHVKDFEPDTALFVPDHDPLIFYSHILKKAIPVLNKGAKIYFEIHDSQGRAMEELLKSFKMTQIEILKDFNQKIRFAKAIFEGK